MIDLEQQQSNNTHQRLYQRRKRRPLTSFTPSIISSASSSSSPKDEYTNSKPNRNFNHDIRNQFLANVFVSFTLVWTFFVFQLERPPFTVVSNIPTKSNIDNHDAKSNAPLHLNIVKEPSLSLRGNTKESQRKGRKEKMHQGLHEKKNEKDVTVKSKQDENNDIIRYQQRRQNQASPQAAFVLVATKDLKDPIKSMSTAIESIMKNTILEHIFVIMPIFSRSILEQNGIRPKEVKQYFEVDLVQHHYGIQMHKDGSNHTKDDGMSKVKVMIEEDYSGNSTTIAKNSTKYGVGQSRRNAAKLIQRYHEEQVNATKSKSKLVGQQKGYEPNDEVILTFLRPDSQIENSDWLDIVTDALQSTTIPSITESQSTSSSSSTPLSPTLNPDQRKEQDSFHFQNAVSFALSKKTKQQQHMHDRKNKLHPQHFHHHYSLQYLLNPNSKKQHTTTSLDVNLMPIHTTVPLDYDLELTKGRAYPTPILEGSATSLLLSTFLDLNSNLNLPLSDKYVTSTVAADIELSLNLWLCGSGIDVLTDLHVEKDVVLLQNERDAITNEEKVWLTREWMADNASNRSSFVSSSHILGGATNYTSISIGDKILARLNHTGAFNNTKYDQILEEMIHHPNYNSRQPHQLEKCRTFDWYTKEVNLMMGRQLQMIDKYFAEELEKMNNTATVKI